MPVCFTSSRVFFSLLATIVYFFAALAFGAPYSTTLKTAIDMEHEKKMARLTGLLYLLVILFAGFSQGYVRGTLFIPDDAAATFEHIRASAALFRLGFVTDLSAFLIDLAISVLLYLLLRPVDKTLSLVAAAFRLLAHPAIGSLNLLNHYMVLEVAGGGGFISAFTPEQQQAMVMLLLEAHKYGYLIAGAFFGLHCLLLGFLLYRSELFPRILGVLMALAAVGYLMESFGDFLFPGNESWLALTVGLTAAAGEISLTLYLLVKGVKNPV